MADPLDIEAIDDVECGPAARSSPSSRADSDPLRDREVHRRVPRRSAAETVETIADRRAGPRRAASPRSSDDAGRPHRQPASSARRSRTGASDIHLEPDESGVRVRYRVDGVLRDVDGPAPERAAAGCMSRVKIMADMDIAERRLPQDGRIQLRVDGRSRRPARRDAADPATARASSSGSSTSGAVVPRSRTSG